MLLIFLPFTDGRPHIQDNQMNNRELSSSVTEIVPFTKDRTCGIKDLSVQLYDSFTQFSWDPRVLTFCATPNQDYYVLCTITRDDLNNFFKYTKLNSSEIGENQNNHRNTLQLTLKKSKELQYCAVGFIYRTSLYVSNVLEVGQTTTNFRPMFFIGISVCGLTFLLLIMIGCVIANIIKNKKQQQQKLADKKTKIFVISQTDPKMTNVPNIVPPKRNPVKVTNSEHRPNLRNSNYYPSAPPIYIIDKATPPNYGVVNPAFQDV